MICAVAIIAITVGVAMQNKGRVRRKTHTYISKRKKEEIIVGLVIIEKASK